MLAQALKEVKFVCVETYRFGVRPQEPAPGFENESALSFKNVIEFRSNDQCEITRFAQSRQGVVVSKVHFDPIDSGKILGNGVTHRSTFGKQRGRERRIATGLESSHIFIDGDNHGNRGSEGEYCPPVVGGGIEDVGLVLYIDFGA